MHNFSRFNLRRKQQGSTLLLILVILMVSAALGVSLVQSSITGERIAGNYRYVVQTDMAAQAGAVAEIRKLRVEGENKKSIGDIYDELSDRDDLLNKTDIEDKTGADLWQLMVDEGMDVVSGDDSTEYVFGFYEDEGQIVLVVIARYVIGSDDLAYSYSQPAFIVIGLDPDQGRRKANSTNDDDDSGGSGEFPNPYAPFFQSTVTACESVAVGGGSRVAFFNSAEQPWNGNFNTQPTDAVVIRAVTPNNANISLTGNEKIYGSIEAIGTVTLTGSSEVFGNIKANGNININGGGVRIHGNTTSVKNVHFCSSGKVDKNVVAQENIIFRNWSAAVGGTLRAGGNIQSQSFGGQPDSCNHTGSGRPNFCDHAAGSCTANDASLVVEPIAVVAADACDLAAFDGKTLAQKVVDLEAQLTSVGDVTIGSWPTNNWRIDEQKMEKYDQSHGVKTWLDHASSQTIEFFGEQTRFFRVGNFVINNTGLVLPDNSGNVFILVNGDLKLGMGGGNALTIGKNSTLTFIVKGKTQVGSSVQMTGVDGVSEEGRPTLSIFSAYAGTGNGVEINGGSALVAYVYAPYSHVTVNSGGTLFGAAYGKSVNVSGNGSIIFDRAIMEAEFGGGGSAPTDPTDDEDDPSGNGKAITGWR